MTNTEQRNNNRNTAARLWAQVHLCDDCGDECHAKCFSSLDEDGDMCCSMDADYCSICVECKK